MEVARGSSPQVETADISNAADVPMQPAAPSKSLPRLFLDLFAGVHSPLTNAVLSENLDYDILDDRVMQLLLRLAHSGLVGLAWSTAMQRVLQTQTQAPRPQDTANPRIHGRGARAKPSRAGKG